MFDKVLGAGAGFDWISPLWSFIQDYRRRPAVRYSIPADCGWHAYAIRNMLQESGIQLWGLALYQETFVFSVRQAQARYAQYLLERAGIPYFGGLTVDDSAPSPSHGNLKPEQEKQPASFDGLLGRISDFVDSI